MRIGIYGYGNLGKALEKAITERDDVECAYIFSRRADKLKKRFLPIIDVKSLLEYRNKIDVLILAGSSRDDLRRDAVYASRYFNVVDSFDIHGEAENHKKEVEAAIGKTHLAILSVGWDPGLLSLFRALFAASFPRAETVTLWGKGISQGHTTAVRALPGVLDARAVTVPRLSAKIAFLLGMKEKITPVDCHRRIVYVWPEKGIDRKNLRKKICTMPQYFADYPTKVRFVGERFFRRNKVFSHRGEVLCMENGEEKFLLSGKVSMSSNPDFTARILLTYAAAAVRMYESGERGVKTVFDIPVSYLIKGGSSEANFRFL